MIKLKVLTEKKENIKKKKEKKEENLSYPDIIMLPDIVMDRKKFIEFIKNTYNGIVEFED